MCMCVCVCAQVTPGRCLHLTGTVLNPTADGLMQLTMRLGVTSARPRELAWGSLVQPVMALLAEMRLCCTNQASLV